MTGKMILQVAVLVAMALTSIIAINTARFGTSQTMPSRPPLQFSLNMPAASQRLSDMVRFQTVSFGPQAPVVAPGLVIGGTDSRHYSKIADNSYRFIPMRLVKEDLKRIHGINERIAVSNYEEIFRLYVQLIWNIADKSSDLIACDLTNGLDNTFVVHARGAQFDTAGMARHRPQFRPSGSTAIVN